MTTPGEREARGYGPPPWGAPPPPGWTPPAPAPPSNRRIILAIALVTLVVVAGAAIAVVLRLRDDGGQVDGPPAGFQEVRTAILSYAVPGDWRTLPADPGTAPTALGVPLDGLAEGPAYTCGSGEYVRGIAGSALIDQPGSVEDTATAIARQLGSAFYSTPEGVRPEVRISSTRPAEVGDVTGTIVEASVRTTANDGCLATTGQVLVLGVPRDGGTAVLVVNGDRTGGPAQPPSPTEGMLRSILDSARLTPQ